MKLNFLLKKVKKDIFLKYPLTLSFMYLATTLAIIYLEKIEKSDIYNLIFSLYISVPLTAKIEGIGNYRDKKFKLISGSLLIVQTAALTFYLKGMSLNEKALDIFLLFASCSAFFFLIPDKKSDKTKHFLKITGAFINSVTFSMVMYLGLTFIIFTIQELFNVKFNSYIYPRVFIAVMGYFFTLVFLSDIEEERETVYSKFLDFMLSKVIAPLLFVYLFILYAYLLKILFIKDYPKNIVPYLTLFYGVAGAFFSYSAALLDKKYIQIYLKVFYKTLIPLVIMAYISIIPRIMQYNLTENRYFVLTVAFWLSILIMADLVSKDKKLMIFQISFLLIFFTAALGPLSAISLSKTFQKNRLEKLLEISKSGIKEAEKKEIYEILNYFHNKHSMKETGVSKEDITPIELMKKLGYSYNPGSYEENGIVWYNFEGAHRDYEINAYDYFIPNMTGKYEHHGFIIDFSGKETILIREKNFTKSVKLEKIAAEFIKKFRNTSINSENKIIGALEYKIRLDEINKEVLIIFNNFSFNRNKNNNFSDIYFDGVIFVKEISKEVKN